MTNFNETFNIPDGYSYKTSLTEEVWQKVKTTWVIAKCEKTGKEITRKIMPYSGEWEAKNK